MNHHATTYATLIVADAVKGGVELSAAVRFAIALAVANVTWTRALPSSNAVLGITTSTLGSVVLVRVTLPL